MMLRILRTEMNDDIYECMPLHAGLHNTLIIFIHHNILHIKLFIRPFVYHKPIEALGERKSLPKQAI